MDEDDENSKWEEDNKDRRLLQHSPDVEEIDIVKQNIDSTVAALVPLAEAGDVLAIEKLIALADLRGNSRVIMPVLLMINGDIERSIGIRSMEIDEFIIGVCISSIGFMRGGRKELLSGIGGAPVQTFSIEEKREGRSLLSRIFGR